MKTAQYQWSRNDGWTPNLPDLAVEQHGMFFVFGARTADPGRRARRRAAWHFKGTAILGCSTSGEIVGDTVIDDSVIATAVEFEHTRLRTASARIGEAKSSYEVGQELARQLNDPSLRHVFVLSDGLNVNGSDLARGLASGGVRGRVDHGRPVRGRYRLRRDMGDRQRRSGCSAHRRRRSVRRPFAGGLWIDGRLEAVRAAAHHHPRRGQRALRARRALGARSLQDVSRGHAAQLPASGLLFPIVVTAADGGEGVVRPCCR